MLDIKKGTIVKEIFNRIDVKGYLVKIVDKEEKCIVYPDLVGDVNIGDEVLLNTTAMVLNLGSGGYHYVIANLQMESKDLSSKGHIMKLRYTPMQFKVLSVEEEDSPYYEKLSKIDSLGEIPVLVGTLHSMLAPLSLVLKEHNLKVAYIMTDGAALPIAFSNMVNGLKETGFLEGTVTIGHAFGGDLEAVNIYSGLLAAKTVFEPDVIIVTMGPGIVGTGTKWGFTGIEQGEILNAVVTLKGTPVCVPRISFADKRDRHKGISHHTLTVLSQICKVKAIVPIADLAEDKLTYILEQIRSSQLLNDYEFILQNADPLLAVMQKSNFNLTTMGRTIDDDPDFFLSLAAAALTAIDIINGQKLNKLTLV